MSNINFFRVMAKGNGNTTETFTIKTLYTGTITIGSVAQKSPFIKFATTWTTTGGLVSSGSNAEGDDFVVDLTGSTGLTTILVTVHRQSNQVFDYFFWSGGGGATLFELIDFQANTDLEEVSIPGCRGRGINVSSLSKLTLFNAYNNLFTTLDVSNNTLLEYLNFGYSSTLTSFDIGYNTALTTVLAQANYLSASGNDDIYIDLDSNGLYYGILTIQSINGRTSASDSARANLISKGWTIAY